MRFNLSFVSQKSVGLLLVKCLFCLLVSNRVLYSSRKNPYPPQGRSSEIPRGRGILKATILEPKYEAKPEFPRGREGGGWVQNKKHSMGVVWIFSGTVHFTFWSVWPEKQRFY